jgi:hypothetical protein
VRDPKDSGTASAGFALIPYLELWALAVEGRPVMSRLDVVSVAGGIAFLSLLGLGATFALRRLGRRAARIHG